MSTGDAGGFAQRARAFAAIHGGGMDAGLIGNVSCRVELLESGDMAMPVTVPEGRVARRLPAGRIAADERPGAAAGASGHVPAAGPEAWVCSPRSTYIDYAAEEAERLLPRPLAAATRGLCAGVGALLDRAGIDRAVTINNWLLSTNLYPALSDTPLDALLAQARERWPGHALWLRSLNAADNGDWLAALEARGFQLVASRQVYRFQDIPALARRHANLARDLRLLKRTPLRRVLSHEFTEADYPRVAELYGLLYLGKYSRLNPDYRAAFMQRWHQAGLLELQGFRDGEGRLACVNGIFRQGRQLTAPVVGYDTALPRSLGLYRLSAALSMAATRQDDARLNFSAGAAGFKRLRGGEAQIEYSAVDVRHLPARTRRAVAALSLLTRRLGVPLMRRYRL